MLKLKKIAFVLSLMAVPFAMNATDADTTAAIMQYKDCMYLNNVAYGNINPTFIKDLPIDAFATLEVSYGAGKGDFHQIDKSGKTRDLMVGVYGVRELTDVSFEGGMSYRNGKEAERKWNATLYQSKLNPFILADSLNSNYSTEEFTLDGRFSWEPIELIRFGVNADYLVGTTSDEQDPRLETKGMRFTINPGIDFKVSEYVKVGATGGIRVFSENSKYSTVEVGKNASFFVMSGMGTCMDMGGTSYQREVKGLAYFADLQVFWQRTEYGNLLNIGFEKEYEKATDGGSSYQFLGGQFNNMKISACDRFSFTKGKFVHNFTLEAAMDNIKGTWFYQKNVVDPKTGSSQWEVMDQDDTKHIEKRMTGSLSYRMDVLANSGQPSWTVGANANFINSDIKNNPNKYYQKYMNIMAGAFVKKTFQIKKSILSLSVGGDYNMNLSNSINMAVSERLRDKYTYPMFDFTTANFYDVYGKLETKIPIVGKRFTSYIGLFAEASTQRYMGDLDKYKNTAFNQFGGGVNYTF